MQESVILELNDEEQEIYFELVKLIVKTTEYIEEDGLYHYVIIPKGDNLSCIDQLLMGLSNCVTHKVDGEYVSDRLIEGVEYIEGSAADIWVNPCILKLVVRMLEEREWVEFAKKEMPDSTVDMYDTVLS